MLLLLVIAGLKHQTDTQEFLPTILLLNMVMEAQDGLVSDRCTGPVISPLMAAEEQKNLLLNMIIQSHGLLADTQTEIHLTSVLQVLTRLGQR